MKKTLVPKKRKSKPETMRAEYRFDYSKAKPNRFIANMSEGAIAVVLDPDVAAVFKSSKAVNALLRSVISAMPGGAKTRATIRVANTTEPRISLTGPSRRPPAH